MFASFFSSASRCGIAVSHRMARPAPFKSTIRMYRQLTTEALKVQPKPRVSIFRGAGVSLVGVGIGAYIVNKPLVRCEVPVERKRVVELEELPPPPTSSVSVYELSFGTVAGFCAGVFIKKGAKAAAFLLGGIFVLLQYFVSFSVVKVDWGAMAGRFERMFYSTDATGQKKSPTIYSLFRWLVNFLTADFQPRASFVAGLALGLRIG